MLRAFLLIGFPSTLIIIIKYEIFAIYFVNNFTGKVINLMSYTIAYILLQYYKEFFISTLFYSSCAILLKKIKSLLLSFLVHALTIAT